MAPQSTLHLIRHAEGYHQLPRNHPNIQLRDAPLTDTGLSQSRDFCQRFPYHDKIDLLCASPLQRAIQTAQLAFAPELERGLSILAIPDAQEAQDDPADTGRPPSELRQTFPQANIDLSLLTENWYVKEGINSSDDESLRKRAKKLRQFLRDRPEQNIALVSHGLFAHYVTEHVDPEGHQTGEYWNNVMWRTYTFRADDNGEAHLIETAESKRRHSSSD